MVGSANLPSAGSAGAGAEIIAIAAALFNLVWVPFLVSGFVAVPDPLLMVPIVAAFLVSLRHFAGACRTRVAVPYLQMLGAMVVFMSVQWTVATQPSRRRFRHGKPVSIVLARAGAASGTPALRRCPKPN
jgi:hypothetical protein